MDKGDSRWVPLSGIPLPLWDIKVIMSSCLCLAHCWKWIRGAQAERFVLKLMKLCQSQKSFKSDGEVIGSGCMWNQRTMLRQILSARTKMSLKPTTNIEMLRLNKNRI